MRGRGAYFPSASNAFARLAAERLRGRGGYLRTAWNKYKKYIPRVIGAGLGAATTGTWAGAQAGWNKGADVSKKILGWGRYRMGGQPTTTWKGHVASMHSTGENGIRITHKEMIGIVLSKSAFHYDRYRINPGLRSTFPWLCGIARNFQQYDISGLAVIYRPSCAEGSTAASLSAVGNVMMMSQQNVLASAPTSAAEVMQTQFSVSGKPTKELLMPVEQDARYGGRMTRHLLIRSAEPPSGAPLQFYDDCVVYVCTEGQAEENVELGRLWLSYDVRLYNPVAVPVMVNECETSYGYVPATVVPGQDGLGTIGNANCFATAAVGVSSVHFLQNDIGLRTAGDRLFIGPSHIGTYYLRLRWEFAMAPGGVPPSCGVPELKFVAPVQVASEKYQILKVFGPTLTEDTASSVPMRAYNTDVMQLECVLDLKDLNATYELQGTLHVPAGAPLFRAMSVLMTSIDSKRPSQLYLGGPADLESPEGDDEIGVATPPDEAYVGGPCIRVHVDPVESKSAPFGSGADHFDVQNADDTPFTLEWGSGTSITAGGLCAGHTYLMVYSTQGAGTAIVAPVPFSAGFPAWADAISEVHAPETATDDENNFVTACAILVKDGYTGGAITMGAFEGTVTFSGGANIVLSDLGVGDHTDCLDFWWST